MPSLLVNTFGGQNWLIPPAGLASGGLLLLLDQWSKRAVAIHAARFGSCGRPPRIRYVRNEQMSCASVWQRSVLVGIWFASLASVLILYRTSAVLRGHGALIGAGAALGGAAGNLIDILRGRPIVDFIDLGCWPIFNLADMAITCGIVVAFLGAGLS